MLRALTSWRIFGVALVLSVLAVAALAVSLERKTHDAALEQVVADAELISELLLEPVLPAPGSAGVDLAPEARRALDAGVERLRSEGRLIGLQVWHPDGHLVYSDQRNVGPLSAAERTGLVEVLHGQPVVEFEREEGRDEATATVLVAPQAAGGPSGLVAEVLLPEDALATSLTTTAHNLYGGAAFLALVLAAAGIGARRRVLRREQEALHDALTGLGNRAMLTRAGTAALSGARRRGGPRDVALLLLDLDGFKTVNDTLGHAVGDELLVQVAAALRSAVRPDDVVVRLGGDEFAVLVTDPAPAGLELRRAEAIVAALSRPFTVERVTLEVGVSIGVAVAGVGGDFDVLLRQADVAMYQAKRSGGGARRYDFADDPHDAQMLGLLSELRHAIDVGQLRLHYQPKASLREGRTVGFEALVRWEHPERGLLPPGAFVPMAERTALLRPLTTWVLRQAVHQCAAWRALGWDVDVAVNIAPPTLLEPGFPEQVVDLLAEAELPGTALELEITETAVMVDPVRAAETLRRLQTMGISVSIDDFGAGYTSLSYLKTLPVRSLKIDRGFVTHLMTCEKDEAVARSVVGLGHDLGLTVVAEGVESSDVRQRLTEMGCDEMQGYLLSRPMPAEDVQPWLLRQQLEPRDAARRVPAGP
ncbi:diguanylate cyclase (GGDEF)-like protein [Kineococcus xinjiangensis]|uniref:Diguanylate cyclase (GGDEF)-like protein n=1 Tax=Kineococcus xinjiangensis TaxID=512762 RepID=A0A2S6IEP8_9ACTN|nr:bifunctional diguanylate cyclase/phosphodiesterase [Kineococcus xinjiangensis]PPK92679.1 diguanylate cyclase (GGDEF)-like protein [Kineococcus xinjiangensis]